MIKLPLILLLFCSLALLLFLNAGRLLSVADEIPFYHADLIVVLGGEYVKLVYYFVKY